VSALLAAAAGALTFAAAWELAGLGVPRAARRVLRRVGARAGWPASRTAEARLRRAGLEGRLDARGLAAAKVVGAALGVLAWFAVLPVAPGRLAPPLALILVAAGYLAPDAWLERRARARAARLVAALPDALDLFAVGAAAGRSPASLFGELARGSSGPLARELAVAVAEIECGSSQERALADLRERVPAPAVASLAAALERSRRYGSPLARELHEQAAALRAEERRRIAERAARAAPKIQLVVALVLVPSVLLVIAAALIAHADALFGAL
jgi:tight adherence protein C